MIYASIPKAVTYDDYKGDGVGCGDINEGMTGSGNCDVNATDTKSDVTLVNVTVVTLLTD